MSDTTYLDLFSGAGGLSAGLEDAGMRGVLALDHWADAVSTHRQNLTFPALSMSIEDFTKPVALRLLSDRPTFVVGGPPCQGYSTIGRRDRDDERNRLFLEFQRVVQFLEPQGFVVENVLGLKDMRFVEEVRKAFTGYAVSVFVLSAADYGVPQLRRRVLFVGHKDGLFHGPSPTHHPGNYVTVWDAIGDLPPLAPGESATEFDREPSTEYQARMRQGAYHLQGHQASLHPPHLVKAISYIPDGGNRQSIPARYQPRSGFHNSYSRLDSRAPAVAVTSNMGKPSGTRCIHPFQHRGLTAREGARLQSFPDTFQFVGGITSQRLQVANAVPPLLARALGSALLDPTNWGSHASSWRQGHSFALTATPELLEAS